jgi:hypothetical protein
MRPLQGLCPRRRQAQARYWSPRLFSKKVENLAHAVALHFMHYNFCRPHQSLERKTTPAMAAGITDHVWTVAEIVALLDQTPGPDSN